jgi:hypothetical protein
MRRRILSKLTLGLVATLALAACGQDNPTAPTTPAAISAPRDAASTSLLGTLLGTPITVAPLQRTKPLASNVSVSAKVGLLGTIISIPSAGLKIVVPALAAPIGTKITVTALAGSNVAYEFAPHGLKFLLPLVATQDLRNTDARTGGLLNPLSLALGYFPDDTKITTITELLSVNVNLLNQTAISTIWHFSGYIFAGGRSDGSDF